MKALSKLREGQAFKVNEDSLEYYFRGEASNGRVKCRCYTHEHERWKWMDRAFSRTMKVLPIKL